MMRSITRSVFVVLIWLVCLGTVVRAHVDLPVPIRIGDALAMQGAIERQLAWQEIVKAALVKQARIEELLASKERGLEK